MVRNVPTYAGTVPAVPGRAEFKCCGRADTDSAGQAAAEIGARRRRVIRVCDPGRVDLPDFDFSDHLVDERNRLA
jgi:hypothetical protein